MAACAGPKVPPVSCAPVEFIFSDDTEHCCESAASVAAYTLQVVLTLKTPYRDGTAHIVMSPLEFMQRLAALVPRPRLNLIRFHGVLAPHAARPPQGLPISFPSG